MTTHSFDSSLAHVRRAGIFGSPIRRSPGAERQRAQEMVDELSRWMDTAFVVPILGWRFGLDALIGLLPGVGDAATTLVSLYILGVASRLGVPKITLARMGMNLAIDLLLGAVPVLGDVFDAWWKANQKNAALLRERMAETNVQASRATALDWIFVGAVMLGLVALFVGLVALVAFIASAAWHAV